MAHKDLTLEQIVYKLVFYNISFSWLLLLDGFQFIFLLRDSENDLYEFKIRMAATLAPILDDVTTSRVAESLLHQI